VAPAVPAAVVGQLAQDQDEEVRFAVARNPDCPPEMLRRLHLLQDPVRTVAEGAVDNPHLPAAARAMWQLARV
jgi:hypothetical protein